MLKIKNQPPARHECKAAQPNSISFHVLLVAAAAHNLAALIVLKYRQSGNSCELRNSKMLECNLKPRNHAVFKSDAFVNDIHQNNNLKIDPKIKKQNEGNQATAAYPNLVEIKQWEGKIIYNFVPSHFVFLHYEQK